MRASTIFGVSVGLSWLLAVSTLLGVAEDPPKAFIDGTGPGWKTLGEEDFARVNGDADSWVRKGADVHGTSLSVRVLRSKKVYTNFEMIARWRHFKSRGNSGFSDYTILPNKLNCVQSLAVKFDEKKPWTVTLGIGFDYRIRKKFRIYGGSTEKYPFIIIQVRMFIFGTLGISIILPGEFLPQCIARTNDGPS